MPTAVLDVPGLRSRSPYWRTRFVRNMKRIGADVSNVAAVISFETGGTFSPTARNPDGAVGLIQWTTKGAKSQGYEREQIARMSDVRQLDLLTDWFERAKPSTLKRPIDYYLAVFAPQAVGKPMGAEVYSIANSPAAYSANQALDVDGNGVIRVEEIAFHFLPVITSARKRPPLFVVDERWPSAVAALLAAGIVGGFIYYERRRGNPSARAEKSLQWGILKSKVLESKDREKQARAQRQTRLEVLRDECAARKRLVRDECAQARTNARLKAREAIATEKAFREEKRGDYRFAVGRVAHAERTKRAKRYTAAESDSLALQNVAPELQGLFRKHARDFSRKLEPDHRAELFAEWVEENREYVDAWQAEQFDISDREFARMEREAAEERDVVPF